MLYPRNDLVERRHDNRYPFPYLVHLTPVGEDGITPEGETVVVVGKHLSEQGFGFYHRATLAAPQDDRLAGSPQRSVDRVSHRPEMVPFHQGRLVRERRPFPAGRDLADRTK